MEGGRRREILASQSLLMGFILVATILRNVSAAVIPGFQECVLNNHHYAVGSMFYPVIELNGTYVEAVCFECVCQSSGIAQCEEVICPPANCENPIIINGECCALCLPPPVLVAHDGCLYHGIHINDGDVFQPVRIIEDYLSQFEDVREECVECECESSNITCRDVSYNCPELRCNETEAEYVAGECCKQCPAPTRTPVHGPGCFNFDGEYILEGQWWHPILPEYGLVECVNCTCENSLPHCERLPCPEVPPCGPDDPVEDIIVCCPKCSFNTPTIPPEPPTTHNDTNTTTPTSPLLFTPIITPCESPYIYKIYRSTETDTLALHNIDTTIVGIYNWTTMVSSGGPMLEREYSETTEAGFVSLSNGDFIFVGWTIDRRVRGLMNKPSKRERIEACTENCARMVANMLRPVLTISETLVCG